MIYLSEKFCHWFQRLTGLTNYWLDSVMSIIIAFTVLDELLRHMAGLNHHWFSTGFMFPPFLSPSSFSWRALIGGMIMSSSLRYAYSGWKNAEAKSFERLSKGLANPRKYLPFCKTTRILFFIFCWINLFMLSVFLSYILESCDPLPPTEGKIQQWFRKMQTKSIPVTQNL